QVIYSLKDMYDGHAGYPQRGISGATAAQRSLDTLKDHPAVLAWYINDELADSWMKPIAKRYQRIIKSDKDHPEFIVSNQPTFNNIHTEITDILGMDPYPMGYPHQNLLHVTDWTQLTVDAAHGAKGVWQVRQMHNAVHH